MGLHHIFSHSRGVSQQGDMSTEDKVFLEKIDEIQKSDFVFVIAGKTQSGKSSLVNLLFDLHPPQEVSHGQSTTQKPGVFTFDLDEERGKLTIVDLPGLGESLERSDEIQKYYDQFFPQADAILWLSRVDVSADEYDQRFYFNLPKRIQGKIVFGISQLDAARGGRWNYKANTPSKKQSEAILNKINSFKKHFKIKKSQFKDRVVLFSTKQRYNIDKLEYVMSIRIDRSAQLGIKLKY